MKKTFWKMRFPSACVLALTFAAGTAFSDVVIENALCEIEMLPTPPAAAHLRGFVFERDGRRVVACWHTHGTGTLAWTLGPKQTVTGLGYVMTDRSRDAVRAAWAAARLTP